MRAVARRLLGCRLVRVDHELARGGIIVETEAYHQSEPASHSHLGPTPRNRSMFERAGTAYVYYIYGSCFCVNVACEPEGVGAAVLIRALEPEFGLDEMRLLRGRPGELTSGPGRLCQALSIDRELDGLDLLRDDRLYLAKGPAIPDDAVMQDVRVGLSRAADLPWRYLVRGNPHVSRGPRRHAAG